jgi:epoxyqueuosine reductase
MMENEKIKGILDNLIDKNIFLYGFADLNGLLSNTYSRFNYGISILRKLDDEIINSIRKGPTKEYYRHYKQVNVELATTVKNIERELKQNGIDCISVKPTFDDSELNFNYKKTLRTELSHKMLATRAGLGWIGKTDLLISYKWGPRVRLASVLLDYPLKISRKPIESSECGKCVLCLKNCPSGAATGMEWNIHTDRDIYFDAFKCQNTCRNLSKERLNTDISICGICVSVCPIGR